jgi:adenylate cyclase
MLWQWFICDFHSHRARWEQAIERCNKSVASGYQTAWPFVMLAAAHAWLGHDKEAKEAAAQVQKFRPGFTLQTLPGMHLSDDPTFNAELQRIIEGLRKAGVPEGEQKTN